jgi:transcriptional regulator with XRE-family HTH domain
VNLSKCDNFSNHIYRSFGLTNLQLNVFIKSMANRLREIRESKGMTQTDVARQVPMATGTYQKYEDGTTKLTDERARQFARILGVTPGAIRGEEAPKIEIYGHILNAQVFPSDHSQIVAPAYDVFVPPELRATAAVNVSDDSLEPFASRGAVLMYPACEFVSPAAIGHISILCTTDGRCLIRRILPAARAGYYNLVTVLSTKPEETVLKWAAPITDIRLLNGA